MHDGPEPKYPSGLFCSPECARAVDAYAPIHKCGLIDGCLIAIITAPFVLTWWCIKKSVKLCWQAAKNKWVWTIFSCGMAWAAWKLLDKIYNPKK